MNWSKELNHYLKLMWTQRSERRWTYVNNLDIHFGAHNCEQLFHYYYSTCPIYMYGMI